MGTGLLLGLSIRSSPTVTGRRRGLLRVKSRVRRLPVLDPLSPPVTRPRLTIHLLMLGQQLGDFGFQLRLFVLPRIRKHDHFQQDLRVLSGTPGRIILVAGIEETQIHLVFDQDLNRMLTRPLQELGF